MKIARFQFNMFGVNTYVVWSPDSKECMIVDPGMISADECEQLDSFIENEGLKVKYLVNTHLHLDHCFGNCHVSQKYGVVTMAHPEDYHLGNTIKAQSSLFGLNLPNISDITEFEPLTEESVLSIGDEIINIIHVPGHSPGGIALYAQADEWVIVGDSIFAGGGIGRTDLPGGEYRTLINSIADKLFTLPGTVCVLSGHGPTSTIEAERTNNPYV